MCCTVIEGQCKRCISDPWTVQSAAAGAYVKEIPRDLISHFNYCRQWRGSLAGALKLLLVFAIILCEFELCCYSFICSFSDHFLTIPIQFVLHRVVEIHSVGEWHPSWSLGEQKVARGKEIRAFVLCQESRQPGAVCAELGGEAFSLCQQLCHTDTGKDNSSSWYKLELAVFGKLLVLTTRRQARTKWGVCQSMPEYARDVQDVPKICPRYAQYMPKICKG